MNNLFFNLVHTPVLQAAAQNNSINWNKTLALVLILAIIILFFALAIYSNILRDEVNDCTSFSNNSRNPFSLSRVQLAVWTVIISCSYVYLHLCLPGLCPSTDLNQTALILMGIGAGVTTTGTLIDKREIQDGRPRHQNSPSEGFFIDLLSDDNGISISRFQNVVWTVIAMVIFLVKVHATKSGCLLPDLSPTLLSLTGISAATYLVIKSQENNPDVQAATVGGGVVGGGSPAAIVPPAPVGPAPITTTPPPPPGPPTPIVVTSPAPPSSVPAQPVPAPTTSAAPPDVPAPLSDPTTMADSASSAPPSQP